MNKRQTANAMIKRIAGPLSNLPPGVTDKDIEDQTGDDCSAFEKMMVEAEKNPAVVSAFKKFVAAKYVNVKVNSISYDSDSGSRPCAGKMTAVCRIVASNYSALDVQEKTDQASFALSLKALRKLVNALLVASSYTVSIPTRVILVGQLKEIFNVSIFIESVE